MTSCTKCGKIFVSDGRDSYCIECEYETLPKIRADKIAWDRKSLEDKLDDIFFRIRALEEKV